MWLLGTGGDEAAIHGAGPFDPEFTDYATGPRARALLSVSAAWWDFDGCVRFRYEDLVATTGTVLSRSAEEFGPFVQDLPTVISSQSLQSLRATSTNQHFWHGTPGLWKRLLTRAQVESIASVHQQVLVRLGYSLDQSQWPTQEQVASEWAALCATAESGAP